jgi:hypothetical protein
MSLMAFVQAVARELRLRGFSFDEGDLLPFLVRNWGTIPGDGDARRWAEEFIKAIAQSKRRAE